METAEVLSTAMPLNTQKWYKNGFKRNEDTEEINTLERYRKIEASHRTTGGL